MLNSELIPFWEALEEVQDLPGVKFAYARSKNKNKIESEIKSLQEAIKPSEDYAKFDKDRIELCEKHCDKDDKDKPVMENSRYVFKNRKNFETAFNGLKKTYNDTLEAREKQIEEYNKLLEEKSDFEIHHVLLSDVPDGITGKQLEDVMEMIKE